MSLKDLKTKTQGAVDFAVEHKPLANTEPRRLVTGPAAQAFSNDTVVEYKRKAQDAEGRAAGAQSKLADVEAKLAGADSKIAEFDGAKPARQLDPKCVRASKWANRHPASFLDPEFLALKADIESAGGNVQAIKVRPVAKKEGGEEPFLIGGSEGSEERFLSSAAAQTDYEIVFGHRRHRACLELGLPVLAVIEHVSDLQLFAEMDRENRDRKDLSAWEQGAMYERALQAGLYTSNRKLAEAIGRDNSGVNRALILARLPEAVVASFASPLDLQYRWAEPFAEARKLDEEGLIARAKALKGKSGDLSAKQIFERLTDAENSGGRSASHADIVVRKGRKSIATVTEDARGRTSIRFETCLDKPQRQELARLIEEFMAK